jgi:radical SAM family RiPP maturation amino acid epimerase
LRAELLTYWDAVNRRSDEELRELAQLKRVGDLLACDSEFRDTATLDDDRAIALAVQHGARPDPIFLKAAIAAMAKRQETDDPLESRLRESWHGFMDDKKAVARIVNSHSCCAGSPFGGWQSRQKLRVASELGEASRVIPHSLITFELSRGCSVGCSFCGIDASKFGGHVPYDDHMAREWPRMIEGLKLRFGESLRSGFLYWGSDPVDNPDYLKYACEFSRIVGVFPQITTAVPLRNVQMIRQALARSPGIATVPHRFSILSLNIFRRVMQTFSADELLHVELVAQLRGGTLVKANAGRAMKSANPTYFQTGGMDVVAPSTIACVTGFLVNIGDRTIKLISPTAASAEWPNGYIEFGERSYLDAEDFLRLIDELVVEQTADEWDEFRRPKFRRDIRISISDDAFELMTSTVRHRFKAYGKLVQDIDMDRYSIAELLSSATSRGNTPGEELLFMRGLYKGGLLELHQ